MSNCSKFFIFCSCFVLSISISNAQNIELNKPNLKATVTETTSSQNKPLSPSALQTRVNINQASAKQISKSFKGFGKVRSLAIVKYREHHGVFKNIDELSLVRGISKRFVIKYAKRLKLTFTL